jgi:hypothetical protein
MAVVCWENLKLAAWYSVHRAGEIVKEERADFPEKDQKKKDAPFFLVDFAPAERRYFFTLSSFARSGAVALKLVFR